MPFDNPLQDPNNQQFYRQDGEDHNDSVENLEEKLEQESTDVSMDSDIDKLQRELNEAMNGWRRAQADFENFRKRKEAESSEWITFGKQAAFIQILPILDSLEQAIKHTPLEEDEKFKQWKIGLDGIAMQIDDAIKRMGIEKIQAEGKKFDPHTMEAVREIDGDEDGMVVEVYQTGYMMSGKVLRPAQVAITSKGGSLK